MASAPADPPSGAAWKLGGYTAFGVGAVVLGLGIWQGVRAKNISDELSTTDPDVAWPDDFDDRIRDGEAAETRAKVLAPIGAGLAVAGAVLFLVGHRAESGAVSVRPQLSPSSAGASVSLGF